MTAGSSQRVLGPHRLELLLDALSDHAIYMLDPDGFVSSWNAGAERLTGYQPVEILGKHFSQFFAAEDQAKRFPELVLNKAQLTGRWEGEGWSVRKDGSRFWSEATVQSVRDDRGNLIGFAQITRDITERVAAHRALLEVERRFRVLVDGVVDYAIYMLDPSGVITNWNTGAQRLKGYTAEEITGQHFSKFYTPEDRARGLPGQVLRIAAEEGRYELEGWRVRKDGSRFWASAVIDAIRNDAGRLEGFAKVTRDITERRAAQDAVRESERQFRLLVAGVIDYALYMLDPNGIITSWNAGAERIKGYTAEEILGQHFSRFYTARDRAAGLPARALYIAAHEGRFEAEGWRVRKDGGVFWANVVVDPIRDEGGKLIGFAKITRDITERREAQSKLQETQARRAHAQKMDALGQLTGGVAHDFNNLLMVVSGHIPTIKARAEQDPKLTRAVEAIEMAARRGATLTRQLLTFSRRQTVNPTVFHLAERIAGFSTILESSISESVKLITTIGPEVWPVRADATEFELAMVNIALNARDAMPGGGTISITAENVTLAAEATPAGIKGDFVALRLSDTGTGIAPDVLPTVFDPFFTTKQVDKGTGLGLSQVHGFAHQSGGTVTIESELGRGTTVTLYLPRAGENEAESRIIPVEESSGHGTVLVVEDNPDVSEISVTMVEQLGYDVRSVPDARTALKLLEKEDFDVVITDVVMPGGMDGLALARTIREQKPGMPVLLVTGYSRNMAEAAAEFPVLHKPLSAAELGPAIPRAIAEAKQSAGSNVVWLRGTRPGAVPGEG